MNSNTAYLSRFFADRRARGEPMVLATIIHTIGSTYRKPGAHMLIGADGDAAGLLSGGCLEGDLIEGARGVLETGTPALVTYDTRTSDDLIWGIGLGCEGAMTILLTRLDGSNDYQPYQFIDATRRAHGRAAYGLVVSDSSRATVLGESYRLEPDGLTLQPFASGVTLHLREDALRDSRAKLEQFPAAEVSVREVQVQDARVLLIPIVPSVRVLILGAGPDVQPLVTIASQLGWQITVSDHRPAYARAERFAGDVAVQHSAATDIHRSLALDDFDAAVVMSHHLISDQHYLAALAHSRIRYVGLLGPAPRRARLLAEIGELAAQLDGRLRGPVGLDLGANTPETIALAIVSEIQAVLAGRSGRPFTEMAGRTS